MKKNRFIYIVSFFSGFLSLSQEIIWMRLISFLGMSVPQTFSFALALFLIGIAIGANVGKNICKENKNISVDFLGKVFFVAAFVDILLIILVYIYSYYLNPLVLVLGLCILICAAVRGVVFPIVHHIGTINTKTGAQISNVYFSNVFGSALAPLLISFVALDFLNTQQVYLLICIITIIIAGLCQNNIKRKVKFLILIFIPFLLMFFPEKIFYEFSKNSYQEKLYPGFILENKHGVIQVYNYKNDVVVFGANVYDGKLNTNIFHNSNGIDRAYLLAALNPHAENILVIGLSTGSWAKVLSLMPNIKKMTIIEINPNYVELIKMYPEVNGLLNDPRVDIIIDDGRKWLKKNSDKKFDTILMNTTWHWRAYGSNLLSLDFIEILEKRLKENGLAFYNTTESLNAYSTAEKVFPNVYKYKYFILGAKYPQYLNLNILASNLCLLKDPLTQKSTFRNSQQCLEAAKIIYKNELISFDDIVFRERDMEVITDNNMITEFKYGKGI